MVLESLLMVLVGQAAAGQASLPLAPHGWTVDYGTISCTLARRLGEEGSPIIAFNAPLGQEPGELVIMDGGAGLDRRLAGTLDVRIDDGAPLAVRAADQSRNGHALVRLTPVPDDFLERLAIGHRMLISKSSEEVLVLPLPDVAQAVRELARCNDDLLQSWGIDIAARHALSRLPRIKDTDWAADIMPSRDTFLIFVADVSTEGRPTDCRIVISSRNERMDRAFCNLVTHRARFEPALDANGRAAVSQYVSRVRWSMD